MADRYRVEKSMKYRNVCLTHTGLVKPNSEDRLYSSDRRGVYLVCDGMGGAAYGEIAADIAIDEALRHETDIIANHNFESIESYIRDVNEKILARSRELNCSLMGTTFALLEFAQDSAYVCSVGDSRVYRLRAGVLEQLTEDHTMVYRMYLDGLLTKEEARMHPRSHVLYQHLGMPEKMGTPKAYIADVGQPKAGDVYIVCSDGLSDMLSDEEIRDIIVQSESIDDAVTALMKQALTAGGKDNISLILVEAFEEQTILDKLARQIIRHITSG